MQLTVGIAQMRVSARAEDVLVTHSLGSCLGVTLHEPVLGIGGMLHCMLPAARVNPTRAADNPCVFTDTGVAGLLQWMFDMGAERDHIVAKVAGGAAQMQTQGETSDFFRIGERNYAILRRVLWKNGILIAAEDVGGEITRTMFLEIETGRTLIKKNGTVEEL